MVHEGEDSLQVTELHPLEVEEGMLVRVLSECCPKEGRASSQDDLVCLQLPGATAQGAVKEVLLLPDLPEGQADVALKIIPFQAEFFSPHGYEQNFINTITASVHNQQTADATVAADHCTLCTVHSTVQWVECTEHKVRVKTAVTQRIMAWLVYSLKS